MLCTRRSGQKTTARFAKNDVALIYATCILAIHRFVAAMWHFFCNNLPEGVRGWHSASMPADTATTPAKPLRVVKPRAPALPHKKLPEDVLKVRVEDTKKRLNVLRSKAVLVEDRLGAYEREVELRAAA